MNVKCFRKMVVLTVALVCVSVSYAMADKLALQEKLSRKVKIQLRDVTIAEALEKIGQKAGVKFVLSDEAAWKLPYGEATRLSVMLDGPLADSMAEMLNAFFMRYAVGDEEITIYPRPELEHILGRPTAKQLELLNAIYTKPIGTYYIDEEQRSINKALGQEVLISPMLIQQQINDLLRQFVGEKQRHDWKDGRKGGRYEVKSVKERQADDESIEFQLPTPVTLAQLFNQVSAGGEVLDYTRWYICQMPFANQIPEIRVVDYGTFRRLRFAQKIDISYKNARLDKILLDLANRGGAKLLVIPGSHLEQHMLSVDMQNVTIEQAARNIIDMVGGRYEFGHNWEIQVPEKESKNLEAKERKTSESKREGYVGKISVPMDGGKYYIEFMLRENDLTEELKNLRAEKMKEVLGEQEKAKPAATPKE